VYELHDAPAKMKLHLPPPSAADRDCAVVKDPNRCAMAQVVMRVEDVPVAQIGIEKAYVPVRENGKIKVYRMRLRKQDKARIDHFDRTNEWPDDEGLWLHGISRSARLDSRRSQNKRQRERWGSKPAGGAKKKIVHLRDASRRAQVHVTEETP
jgi:hypothetical protein